MLTNPSTSSTSVSSSSLVEASSLSSPSSTAAPTSGGNATPNLQNSAKPKTPAKRRKKDNTDVELVVPIAVESSSAVVNDNSKKRSRKQKIDTFRNEYDLPILEGLSAADKSAKRKRGGRKNNSGNNVNNSRVQKEGSNVKKNTLTKNKGSNASAPPEVSKKSKKSPSKTTTTAAAAPPPDDSVVSYGPQSKIVLKKNEFIDPNLSFTIFSDLSRGLGAIGPSQVILAVESTREPGSREAFFKDLSDSDSRSTKKPIVGQFQLFDLLLSVPHFLPLTSVYSAGEPFARILRYSALEQYTNGVQGKNQVSTFRFYGPRYEKQVPALPASQEKAVSVTAARDPNAYLDSVLIIKHPILGFYSRKLVSLKFVVLKKVPLDSCVVGHLKAKVVQLRRSADLKNIEIYVDESRVPEAASDVSAMNQQNIQPVIQTPSGLVPVITRTAYQPQQEYQIQPQQELAETQFQYVQYQYQTATELVQEISSNSVGGPNNYILSLDNSGLLFDGAQTFRDETGAQVLILSPSGDDNYVHQHQQPAQQQQIIHQLQDHASYYPGQEQSVIIQQHPQTSQLQQQQSYTIQQQQAQQQHQQLIQLPPPQPSKEVTRQLIYLPGSNCPIELQFVEPSQQEDSNRHYNQPQQIQVQVQSPQQYRPGQQLVVQQNQFQIQQQQQAIQQHVINSQGQVVRQQQLLQQNNTSTVSNSAQSFQFRTTTQQQSQQIVHHTSQQQHHQIPAPVSNQSVAIQQSHQVHPGNQVSTIQALPSSSQQVRYQSAQQQGHSHTQQVHQTQLVQQVSGPQLIQQQAVPVPQAQQSPQKAALPPQVPVYQQQRPQQYQQQFPQGGTPYTPPVTTTPQTTAPINTTTPSKQKGTKTKQPKGSPKKNAKSGNLNQASTNLDDQYLSPQQIEQLRQREQKGLAYQPQQSTPPPPPPAPIPSQQSFPPVAPPLTYPAPAQAGACLPSPSSVRPKGRARPPAPPPPIISSTAASLARLPSVSPGTSARLPVAPNSQTPSTASSALSVAPKPAKKTFYVVNSNASGTSSPTATSGPANAVTTHVPLVKTKPGFIALCPRCGVGNTNIVRCQRCKVEFPANVKLIQDDWNVNRAGAVVAVASKTSSPRTTTPSPPTTSDSNKNSKVPPVASSSAANSANNKVPAKNSAVGKKIVLVNKPNILESSAVIGKTVVTPGTVQVRIQPDGGSAVTITNSGTSVVQTKLNTPVSKPPARKRPTQRKKLECITLSSDEEEPEPKVPKQDEKPSTSTTTASDTSATSTATTSTVAATTASATTSTAATVTATSAVTSSATITSGVVSGTQSQVGNSDQVPSVKKEIVGVVSSTIAPPAEADMSKKKGLQINLTPQKKDQPPQKEEIVLDPNEVYGKIDSEMSIVGNKFQYTQLECRSIRVGSYKVTLSDVGHNIAVQVTELGFKFTLPCANFKRKIAKVCIPVGSIIDIKACFNRRLTAFFIMTGPKYAAWIRQHLGMEGDAGNETSNFYCPLDGLPCQRTITILGEAEVSAADVGIVKKIFKDVLTELDYKEGNDFLMKISSMKYKCSIGMNPDNSPPEATGSPTDRQMAIPPASSSTLSSVSQATTGLVSNPKDQSTPAVNSAGSSVTADQDTDKVVLSYEGPNSNKVAISPNDIKGLGYSQFLNDQIIDFWLAVIQMERLSGEDKQKTFVFDSFFYKKLTEKIKRRNEEDGNMTAGERRHARVKKRTKNVDIFSKDFLIVPINENYHWFLAIICFPGLEGFHDYNSLEALPNYKRPRTTNNSNKSSASNNNKKPIVYNQPKSETTSSYSSRDEAPEDSEEMDQMSSPDTPGTDGSEPKSQGKTESGGESSNEKGSAPRSGEKRKSEFGVAVKHPCILIFDSLAGDARGRIYSTLREYLRIEYKTKKNAERSFDKNAMPGIMPKVPQQPNFSDCGLFLLQYVENFFSDPIPNYDPKDINLKNWFTPASIAENKRREIYDFILNKVREKSPHNECRIPAVSFEPDENDLMHEEEMFYRNHPDYDGDSDDDEFETEDDSDEDLFTPKTSRQPSNNRLASSSSSSSNKKGSDSDDHNYATTPPKPGSMSAAQANTNTVVVAIAPLPATSDTTLNKNT